jgi:hypothetical protein
MRMISHLDLASVSNTTILRKHVASY